MGPYTPSASIPLSIQNSCRRKAEDELTERLQSDTQPRFSLDYNTTLSDSTTLTFPTLSPDGSTEDISAEPTHVYLPTPPAALSSLGARLKMPPSNMSDSTSSLDDNQYDMVDDASEASNDDRETASLPSTREDTSDDGEPTPGDTGSLVDVEEEREQQSATTAVSIDTLQEQPRTASDSQTLADDKMFDSFLLDELETPRQSTITPSIPPPTKKSAPVRILFTSDRSVSDAEIAHISRRIGSLLAPTSSSSFRLARLPPTPTGISPSSALLLRSDDVDLAIEHCVGAEVRSTRSECYALRIQDSDREHTSIFTIGRNGKVDLETPDLIVFYLKQSKTIPKWFAIVKQGLSTAKIPTMTVCGPDFDLGSLGYFDKQEATECDVFVDHKTFFDEEDTDLRDDVQDLLNPTMKTPAAREKPINLYSRAGIMQLLLLLFAVGIGYIVLNTMPDWDSNPATDLAFRRMALSKSLLDVTNSTEITNKFDIEHLVPASWSTSDHQSAPPRFQAILPNHIVVALPKRPRQRLHQISSTQIRKSDGRDVTFNMTKLVGNAYHYAIAPQEAYGIVTINVNTRKPALNVSFSHNFGSKMWQRKTYEAARTDLSKSINNDVALPSKRVKGLKEKLGLEIAAGAIATKNVTTELALYVARDLQVFAHTAVSVIGKAAAASNDTAARLRHKIQHDAETGLKELAHLNKEIQKSLATVAHFTKDLIPTKKTLHSSLSASRQHALGLKDRLSGMKKNTNSTSATKELSLRIQNIFNPSEKTKRAGSLSDIARCARSEDYLACRRDQRLRAKALAEYKPTSGLIKTPEADAVKKTVFEKVSDACNKGKCKMVKANDREFKKAAKKMDREMRKMAKKEARRQR